MSILNWMHPLEETAGAQILSDEWNRAGREDHLLNTNSRYIITVNDSIRANALTTMLPNDMSTYEETLEPGQSQELVLLLEVNEDVAGAVQTIALRLKNASNEYTIQLL